MIKNLYIHYVESLKRVDKIHQFEWQIIVQKVVFFSCLEIDIYSNVKFKMLGVTINYGKLPFHFVP